MRVLALGGIEDDGTLGFLQQLGLGVGNLEAGDDVVGQVVAAHAQHAGVDDRALLVRDVIGDAAAEIDDNRAELLLVAAQDGLRRGVGTERVILHVDAEFLHAANRRLEPRRQAVDLVKMGGELLRGEADRVVRRRAVIEHIMLQQMMDDRVVGRERLGGRHVVQFLQVFLGDLVAVVGNQRGDARIRGTDMRSGNGQVNLGDHHIGLLLGLGQRVAHATLRDLKVDDLALAHLARRGLPDAQQGQRAVGSDFPHGGGDFGAANFKCDDDIA